MCSPNKITGVFDHQYFWNETKVLDFLRRDSNQRKIGCNTTTPGWVWRDMSSHTQWCLDLPGVNLIGLGVATWEVIQSKRSVKFYLEKVSCYHALHVPLSDWLKCVLAQSHCSVLWSSIYVQGNSKCLRLSA